VDNNFCNSNKSQTGNKVRQATHTLASEEVRPYLSKMFAIRNYSWDSISA
jgi:hypothetical protein